MAAWQANERDGDGSVAPMVEAETDGPLELSGLDIVDQMKALGMNRGPEFEGPQYNKHDDDVKYTLPKFDGSKGQFGGDFNEFIVVFKGLMRKVTSDKRLTLLIAHLDSVARRNLIVYSRR